MNTAVTHLRRSKLFGSPIVFALLALTGCLEQHLSWSPDGKHGAVIDSENGLSLCDVDGVLSAPLMPNVFRVAWMSDSQQLVIARKHSETKWAAVAKALGEERSSALVSAADVAWQQLQTGGNWSTLAKQFNRGDLEWKFAAIYLRERYGEAMAAKLDRGEWDEAQSRSAEIHELIVSRIDGRTLTVGAQLYEGVDEISDFRVSPDDKVVAFVAELKTKNSDGGRLWVVPIASPKPSLVAERVAAYPDWTADGRSLVYVQASGESSTDELRLGSLVQREVRDAGGKIQIQSEQKDLAGWIFSDQSRVRCLRDGRILFNAAEIALPIAVEDYGEQHEQLFVVDPAHQATLVRMIPRKQEENLPKGLTFFELSPDERQVLIGDVNGSVCVLTLATGALEKVQEATKDQLQGAPVWRANGEFTFTRRTEAKNGENAVRAVEVVLRRGDETKVISASWPDAMVNRLYSKKR